MSRVLSPHPPGGWRAAPRCAPAARSPRSSACCACPARCRVGRGRGEKREVRGQRAWDGVGWDGMGGGRAIGQCSSTRTHALLSRTMRMSNHVSPNLVKSVPGPRMFCPSGVGGRRRVEALRVLRGESVGRADGPHACMCNRTAPCGRTQTGRGCGSCPRPPSAAPTASPCTWIGAWPGIESGGVESSG